MKNESDVVIQMNVQEAYKRRARPKRRRGKSGVRLMNHVDELVRGKSGKEMWVPQMLTSIKLR